MTPVVHWVPADGQRHASTDSKPVGCYAYPATWEVKTLCGLTVTAADGKPAWLWETCPTCNARAKERARGKGKPNASDHRGRQRDP